MANTSTPNKAEREPIAIYGWSSSILRTTSWSWRHQGKVAIVVAKSIEYTQIDKEKQEGVNVTLFNWVCVLGGARNKLDFV